LVTVQNILGEHKKKKNKRKKEKQKSLKKMFIGFYRRKQNKGKLDQISSELAQI